MKTVAITGHRPEKIPDPERIKKEIAQALTDVIMPGQLIQGMAAGVDIWSAQVAYKLGIPYVAAQPWHGHTARKADVADYEKALKNASDIHIVTHYDYYPGAFAYQRRNEWMVDNADCVLAVWDGSGGGTANCVRYAQRKPVPVYRIHPVTYEKGWLEDGSVQV